MFCVEFIKSVEWGDFCTSRSRNTPPDLFGRKSGLKCFQSMPQPPSLNRRTLLLAFALLLVLMIEMEAQDRPRLRADSLLPRRCSPWVRLLQTGDDRDFVFVMGLDRATF